MLRAMGISGKDLERMVLAFSIMNNGRLTRTGNQTMSGSEWGVSRDANGTYREGNIIGDPDKYSSGGKTYEYYRHFILDTIGFAKPTSPNTGSFFFHGHFVAPRIVHGAPSKEDMGIATDHPNSAHIIGTPFNLYLYDSNGKLGDLASGSWWSIKCP
jgi:hypothetical protein